KRAEHDDACARVVRTYLSTRLDPAAVRQTHVHDHDIWRMAARGADRVRSSRGIADHLEPTQVAEQVHQTESNQPVIVDDHDPDGPLAHMLLLSIPTRLGLCEGRSGWGQDRQSVSMCCRCQFCRAWADRPQV